MRILKEKKGIIISFIIGVIIASSITVCATSYLANQVSYTKLNETSQITVEDALNDLYAKVQNVYFDISSDSNNTTQSDASFDFGNSKNRYKYFKILSLTKDSNVDSSKIIGWSVAQNTEIELNLNQEYEINSTTDGYNFSSIILFSNSKSAVWSRCTMRVVLYN